MDSKNINVHVRAKVSAVGAIAIPIVVRRALNIESGTYVYFSVQDDGTVVLIPQAKVGIQVGLDL